LDLSEYWDRGTNRLKTYASSKVVRKIRKSVLAYILILFIVSRALYIIVGDEGVRSFDLYVPPATTAYTTTISSHLPIQMWYIWDAPNYGNLAREYSTSLSVLKPSYDVNGTKGYYLLHWFPLYPLLSKGVSSLTSLSIPYSQLVVSNLAFIVALYLLYKLIRIDEKEEFSRNVVALLVLLPTSFIFSAALSESLFLALAVASLYFARKQRWILAGVMGFLLALTHAEGFLMALPLLVEALQQYGIDKRDIKKYIKPLIACATTVAGILIFMVYCWIRTKNPFAYVDSQKDLTGLKVGNPLIFLYHYLFKFKTLVALGEVILVLSVWRKVRWSYIAYTLTMIVVVLSISSKTAGIGSILRYVSVLFPVAIAAAYLAKNKLMNPLVWMTLGILNGAFFILWVNWWTKFII
jgi:hypothetical protein